MHDSDLAAQRQAWWRRQWRTRTAWAWLLRPVADLYGALVRLRRLAHARQWQRTESAGCPVIVVGNVTVGGAGKTPVTMALVQQLRTRGWHPGIIGRGYGRTTRGARSVGPDSTPDEVGDEPLLLHQRTGAPCAVAERRIDAARMLLAQPSPPNLLVCDDGLQHLALARNLEICVFNDEGVGNGWLLPAGPLREPWPRRVDAVLYAGMLPPMPAGVPAFALHRQLSAEGINAAGERIPIERLREQTVHAVAAIARPEDFFGMLRAEGLTLASAEARPDHAPYADWQPPTQGTWIVCTEKDAAKIWKHRPDAVAIPLEMTIEPAFWTWLDARCNAWPHASRPHRPI
ncbi:tetraacyldisaccharide 4'-kinase [Acidovorax lacteus]|uniref:Tetraacyldisaccharide 4'-kinase n=1 Tax=Acidovorax lacteus TaxID=1924988 RepID=A0ABP8L4Q7_9BURK